MSNQNYQNNREKTLLDDPNLKLYAPPIGNGRSPSLQFYYANNNPRIDLWTNVESDKDRGLIRCSMHSLKDLYTFFKRLEGVINDPTPDVVYTMDNWESKWNDGIKKFDEARVETKLVCGRDKEGRVFVSLLSANDSRPKVIFYFGLGKYHKITRRGGAISESDISSWCAEGWLEAIRAAYAGTVPTAYTHKDKENTDSKPNRNSSYSNRKPNSHNSSDDGDDLPF